MWISDFSIRRPVITIVVMLGLVLFGIFSAMSLDTDEFPEISPPVVVIAVPYPGASPETVEREIVDPIEEGVAAIAEVPTGGHFFGSPHTLARYETAFYEPLVSDWQNYESWEAAGSLRAEERATRVWQEALERYEEPVLEPERAELLDTFVERRQIELGDVDH